ncbi:MAG: alpha/beta hydrolase [Clostridia bacterium]|nr:alpha/beta hydrolase [Clostridia bacterium]
MKNSFAKRLSLTLVVILLALTLALSTVGLLSKKEPKRGIVIVTAFLSGGLYLNNPDGTQTQLWDPLKNYEDFPVQDVVSPTGFGISEEVINKALKGMGGLTEVLKLLDEENGLMANMTVDIMTGKSIKDISPANPDSPNRLKYGAINCYKETYDSMLKRYGEKAEVVVFNYDWRLDNDANANLLEEFINERGYDEVVLTSHSMGGSVVGCYLQKAENREKVVLYTPYSSACLGAVDALVYIEDITRLLGGIDLGAVGGFIDVNQIVKDVVEPFLSSLVSMYQLFPSPYLMESGQYGANDYMITVDGEPITSREELIEFYLSRPFAKRDGEWIYPFQREENGKTRLENYWDAYMVEVDGNKVHSMSLVNTVYFIGVGQKGMEGVSYVTNENGEVVLDEIRYSTEGDNMILEYSATSGSDPRGANVVRIEHGHLNVGINFNALLMERTFLEIDKVWG